MDRCGSDKYVPSCAYEIFMYLFFTNEVRKKMLILVK